MKYFLFKANLLLLSFICAFTASKAQLVAGSMAGTPNVSSSGAFTYSIPLALLPGIKDLVPQLAITYNSQAGNGVLGMGWNIAGLSAISRIPSDIHHNGGVNPVGFVNDIYALDGSRLSQTTPGNFETYSKSFSRITSVGSSGSGPDHFIVENNDGMVYEYGNSSNSKFVVPGSAIAAGEVHTWALNTVRDRTGNYISFIYANDLITGENTIAQILYGGNNVTFAAASEEVNFIYTTRTDANFGYVGGSKVRANYKLDQVEIKHAGTLEHRYVMGYTAAPTAPDFYTHLETVTELGRGGSFFPETKFIYGTTALPLTTGTTNLFHDIGFVPSVGDFNGDGFSDIYHVRTIDPGGTHPLAVSAPPPHPYYKMYTNSHSDNFSPLGAGLLPAVSSVAGFYDGRPASKTTKVDFNGDGKDDLITISYNTTDYLVYLNLANTTGTDLGMPILLYHSTPALATITFPEIKVVIGDFVGNGKKQVMIFEPFMGIGLWGPATPYMGSLVGDGFVLGLPAFTFYGAMDDCVAIDIDGDGRDEIFATMAGLGAGCRTYSIPMPCGPSGTPTSGIMSLTMTGASLLLTRDDVFHYGDFNGDGKTDILTWKPISGGPSGQWFIDYSTGDASFDRQSLASVPLQTSFDPGATPADHNYIIADYNGDGKDDIFQMSGTSFTLLYSKGNNTFTTEIVSPSPSSPDERLYSVGDFNGDGQADILFTSPLSGVPATIYYFRKNEQKHLIKKVEKNDNLFAASGQTITVSYMPLAQDYSYMHSTATIGYPFSEIRSGGMKVAKSLINNRTLQHQEYYYRGCVAHRTGLGFRGFEGVMVQDAYPLRQSRQEYDQTTFQTVVPKEITVATCGACSFTTFVSMWPPLFTTLLTKKQFIYHEDALSGGIHIVYPWEETSEDYVNNLHSKTTYTYLGGGGSYPSLHNYGKPDKITTDIGYGREISEQVFTYSTGAPQFYNKDNPATVTTTNNRAGSTAYNRAISYSYNPAGLVANMKTDPGTPHENSITYNYDAWGNVTSEASIVAGTASVTNTYAYSADHRFQTQKTNTLGHTESYTHDAWGNVLTATNINGVVTTNTYDGFNRLITSINSATPTITATTAYHWANALGECPTGIFSLAIEKTVTGITGSDLEFYDYSGKVRRSVSNGFDGTRIFSDAEYNPDGTISAAYLPRYLSTAPESTAYTYDVMGRLESEVSPVTGTTNYSYAPISLSTAWALAGMRINAVNTLTTRSKETTTDASGKTVEITDCGISTVKKQYNSNGNISETIANGILTLYNYDAYGNLDNELAPNKNYTDYAYDNRNRMVSKTDGNSITTNYQYDALNRVTAKNGPGEAFTYTYDGGGLSTYGNLTMATGPMASTSALYSYDVYSRLLSSTETISGVSFATYHTYDNYGRSLTTTYPDGNVVRKEYNNQGYLHGLWAVGHGIPLSLVPDIPLWYKVSENVFGQTTSISLGFDPSVTISASTTSPAPIFLIPMMYNHTHSYNAHGFLTASQLSTPSAIFNSKTYTFSEPTADLLQINDVLHSKSESFTYDALDRLTTVTQFGLMVPTGTKTFEYADNGNMTKKSDISTYDWNYDKYAVTVIPMNGSVMPAVIPSFTQTATYTSFDKVAALIEGTKSINFAYNTEEQRGRAQYYTGPTLTRTRYYAENYERTITPGGTQQISYVMAEGKPVAMFVTNGLTGPSDIKYIGTDHLGSITEILNSTGSLDEQRSYDAWGRMRDPGTWVPYTATTTPLTDYDRGYTGQELLKDFNVINLNGRLYDPLIGRMFSVDPYISNPDNAQTYNIYSYCNNNPLKYTDKDGNEPISASILIVAGLIGGTMNAVNNWDKITDLKSFGSYFGVGAISGAASVFNPWAGGAMALAGNVALDASTNNLPDKNDIIDIVEYGGTQLLNATSVAGAGPMARAGMDLAVKWGWKQTVTGGSNQTVYVEGIGYTFAQTPILSATKVSTSTLVQSGAAAMASNAGKYSVYLGIDKFDVIRYVGMTGRDAAIRFGEQLASGTSKSALRYKILDGATNLSKTEARIWEQKLINQYGLGKNGGQLFNKINSISPKKWWLFGIH